MNTGFGQISKTKPEYFNSKNVVESSNVVANEKHGGPRYNRFYRPYNNWNRGYGWLYPVVPYGVPLATPWQCPGRFCTGYTYLGTDCYCHPS